MAEYINKEEYCENYCRCSNEHCDRQSCPIWKAPAADVAPVVHGRWIEDHDYLKCPKCGAMVKRDFTFFDIGDWHYCPNCGAKMEVADD